MSDAASSPEGAHPLTDAANAWTDALLWSSTAGDVVIAAACFGLSVLLVLALQRRSDLPRPALLSVAACLLLIGLTHALGIGTLGPIQQWLLAGLKDAAAAAALIGAALLWRGLPQLLSIPSREQLERAQAVVAHSHEELESFMSSVSHDLRSPLTTIAGQAGLLELSLGTHATDDLKRRVSRIHRSVRHMSELIEALLALSRIARHEFREEVLDISSMAASVVEELRRKDPHREVRVTIQPQLQARGDRRMAGDLLGHLIGNAWKFTSRTAQASIEIGATSTANGPALFVRDNGAGFDMAYASKLFKPFQRLHTPSEFEGAGIGLAGAARIITRHSGKIWVQATPSEGAVFYFTLLPA